MHEAIKDWERRADELRLEQEKALEDMKGFLDGLSVEEAETAVHGLHERLHEAEHPPVEELVMGWERFVMSRTVPDIAGRDL